MINFVKKLLRLRVENKNVKLMKREYEVLMYFIKDSDSLQDFVFCKKKKFVLVIYGTFKVVGLKGNRCECNFYSDFREFSIFKIQNSW